MRAALPRLLRSRPVLTAVHNHPLLLRTYATRLPLHERIRRKLWGTEKPPGPEDPYTSAPGFAPEDSKAKELTIFDDPDYIAATDGRGLRIAGLEDRTGTWEVDSFIPDVQVTDTEGIYRAVHRATVEALTLRSCGRIQDWDWDRSTVGWSPTERVDIVVEADGAAKLVFESPEVEEAVVKSVVAEEVKEEVKEGTENEMLDEVIGAESVKPVQEAVKEVSAAESEQKEGPVVEEPVVAAEAAPAVIEETVEGVETPVSRPQWLEDSLAGNGWVYLPIADDELKFIITKRILQLTGQRVPDATVSHARTVTDILTPLLTPPKPKKLAEELVAHPELAELPNVKVFPSRIRPLDKERMIGRAQPYEKAVDYTYKGIDRPRKTFKGHVVFR